MTKGFRTNGVRGGGVWGVVYFLFPHPVLRPDFFFEEVFLEAFLEAFLDAIVKYSKKNI